jgi:hypothetical protein
MDEVIFQGSTPVHEITLPIHTNYLKTAIVTYKQDGQTVLEKKTPDVEFNEYDLVIHLTQEETLSLVEDKITEIQVKIKTLDGEVVPSDVIYAYTRECFNKEIL